MSSNNNDNNDIINDIINDSVAPVESLNVLTETPSSNITTTTDTDEDYNFTRENLKDLVDKGNDALDGILELAKESEHPRAYEVVGQLIKTLADANRDIIDLQKNMKDLKKSPTRGPNKVTNALFVGSTHDLQKMLKQESSKKE